MIGFVKSTQVLSANGADISHYNYRTGVVSGKTRDIPCIGTQIAGAFWRIPNVVSGILQINKYSYVQAFDSVLPTIDSQKVLRVKNGNDTWELAIASTDYTNTSPPTDQFATLCDGAGGTLGVMPTVTIPFPIIQQSAQTTTGTPTTTVNTFILPFPKNPLGLVYTIANPWFNGVAPGTPYASAGITTAALFVTWANSNWSTYGTWTSVGDIVTLVSSYTNGTPVNMMGLLATLTPAAFCIDQTAFGTPATINGIQFGTATIIPFGAIVMNATNMQTVINAIRPFFEDDVSLLVSGTHKINILTVLATPQLYNGGVSVVTASAGACT